jgi:hypothetical protein
LQRPWDSLLEWRGRLFRAGRKSYIYIVKLNSLDYTIVKQ